jgi:hypothetical protein
MRALASNQGQSEKPKPQIQFISPLLKGWEMRQYLGIKLLRGGDKSEQ